MKTIAITPERHQSMVRCPEPPDTAEPEQFAQLLQHAPEVRSAVARLCGADSQG